MLAIVEWIQLRCIVCAHWSFSSYSDMYYICFYATTIEKNSYAAALWWTKLKTRNLHVLMMRSRRQWMMQQWRQRYLLYEYTWQEPCSKRMIMHYPHLIGRVKHEPRHLLDDIIAYLFFPPLTTTTMSGSDIRDILQLGKPSESSGIKKAKLPTERRPGTLLWHTHTDHPLLTAWTNTDGISRELYSLIGSAPSVALLKPTYKAKFNVKKKATPWYVTYLARPLPMATLVAHVGVHLGCSSRFQTMRDRTTLHCSTGSRQLTPTKVVCMESNMHHSLSYALLVSIPICIYREAWCRDRVFRWWIWEVFGRYEKTAYMVGVIVMIRL